MKNVIKVYRYLLTYGVRRTIIKISGRKNIFFLKVFFPELFLKKTKIVSLVGCGQFGFSSISFFLLKNIGNRFLDCYDIDEANSNRTSLFWGYNRSGSFDELIANSDCRVVYIASNHASHTDYAIRALRAGKIVYVEKPISVSRAQFGKLLRTLKSEKYEGKFFVGYNRPFSKAIKQVVDQIRTSFSPITYSAVVAGHFLSENHWYRNPEEGSRICGNVGHWIDLGVHFLFARGYCPEEFFVTISYSNVSVTDDNLSIAITSEFGDLLSIILTSRHEPLEGIDESIVLQTDRLYAKIDDFRRLTIWQDLSKRSFRYWPKDVGHSSAIVQPFSSEGRSLKEVEISTFLMIELAEMVKNGINKGRIKLNKDIY